MAYTMNRAIKWGMRFLLEHPTAPYWLETAMCGPEQGLEYTKTKEDYSKDSPYTDF